jgi:hypothetical protein
LGFLALGDVTALARGTRLIRLDDGGRQTPVVHASAAVSMDSAPGSGLQLAPPILSNLGAFNIVIQPGATLTANAAALAAFNRAADQWEAFIADPIVVTIDADLAPLGPGILGSANSVVLFGGYTSIRNAMVSDALDELDDMIATQLPIAVDADFFLPTGFDLDGNVQVTKANAKALGFTNLDTLFGASDGNITFSSQFNFDFDNSDGIVAGQFDFETVAAHEIGHALGFLSDVDYIDAVLNANQTANDVRPTSLDLFRFENNVFGRDPGTIVDFGALPRSLVPGIAEMFDQISGGFGGSLEVLFSTGDTQGDGQQASHWKDSLSLGVMDPTLSPGEISPISPNDLRAMDLIGYEIQAPVPEPGAFALAIMGTVALLGRRRI